MIPLWIKFQDIPWGSIGWRMGPGEDYWHQWTTWFKELSAEAKANYKNEWPATEHWSGFYDFIERGTTPPWIIDDRKRLEAAGYPPEPLEKEITDPQRVRWLLTRYLKRTGKLAPRPIDVEYAAYYSDPANGELWVVHIPNYKVGGTPKLERAQ